MRSLLLVACLPACVPNRGVTLVRSAQVVGPELVVEMCHVTANENKVSASNCNTTRSRVPVVVDEREVPVTVDRAEAKLLAAGLGRARYALAACGGTATLELHVRIDDAGRAIAVDAGAGRADIAKCVLASLAQLRFPAAQRGSELVLAVMQ